ncbi:nicotinate-nucleotide adenylyltransferase [bacterium]|nr:nicotinate-nucleotide adenylyltransferase [bacterium]
MKWGILGGSFDPLHIGHLVIAEYVREEFQLDRIIFLVAFNPPHKEYRMMSAPQDRLEMTRSAVEDNPAFQIGDLEFEDGQSSYTVEVLKTIRSRSRQGDQFYLLIGSDSLLEIKSWHKWEQLWEYAKIVVIPRKNYPSQDAENGIRDRILLSSCPLIDISSTIIRERVKNRKSIRYLVPPVVSRYISSHKLYL